MKKRTKAYYLKKLEENYNTQIIDGNLKWINNYGNEVSIFSVKSTLEKYWCGDNNDTKGNSDLWLFINSYASTKKKDHKKLMTDFLKRMND